ncbi:c-type cytochrome [Phnomibacter sp. MR]|uniref:c-type cytochrome n=1 Tax=Phnomibacter sp. MR TaxID=3042318 RepID=UPI003A7FE7EB
MKKLSILLTAVSALLIVACSSEVKRKPGSIYMPDMANSRAYETYADHSNLKDKNINYNNQPVAGTVSKGETYVYHLVKDANGDTANYFASRLVENPVTSLNADELKEAERQYLINCGICHGEKLDGNGPLWKGGEGPYPAKPATLVGDAKYEAMTAGTMFYSITYGRNLMGAYASQLTPKQRWDIIHYIKLKQGKVAAAAAPAATAAVVADSTKATK